MAQDRDGDHTDDRAPNFIHERIEADLAAGRVAAGVVTRFPPEPNGYLHIGHAKAIWVSFGSAEKFGGKCNLRFDDTNPTKEEVEYVDAIKEDIRWLGFDWQDRLFFASDYYEQLYGFALKLIEAGKAYVDSSSAEEISRRRGDFHNRGQDSPSRDRSVEENLDLFKRMRAGEFEDGAHVLRAKIDMGHGNINMRDPTLYRILHVEHHRTGDAWCIYPMYDFAHGQSDALEGVTHSLCTLEFEDHRPLYDWLLQQLELPHRPQQIEFAPLLFNYTLTSKRYLRRLVEEKLVSGWDDPRMPTLAGLRRRGYSPGALIELCERVGVSKRDSTVELSLFEYLQREDLNARVPRVMVVLRPLRVVIENYPEDAEEHFEALNHPEYPERGSRQVPFSRVLYIERDDFKLEAPKKWFRLAPGREVRLRNACLITCKEVIEEGGEVVELRCTWDPESRGGSPADGRKVKGTLHWVSASHAIDVEARLYDRLFSATDPQEVPEGGDFIDNLNPQSVEILTGCKAEPSLAGARTSERFQFERLGYFCVDRDDAADGGLVFNRTLALRDSWAKIEKSRKG